MRAFLCILLFSVFAYISFGQPVSPGGVDGAVLWLHTVQEGNTKSVLHDRVCRQNLTVQSHTYTINRQASFYIDSKNAIEQDISLTQIPKLTFLGVFSPLSQKEENVLWSIVDDDSLYSVATENRLADVKDCHYLNYESESPRHLPTIFTCVQNRNYDTLNTKNLVMRIANKPGGKSLPAKDFSGLFPEMLLYDRALTYPELCRVQSYFALKYGISLDQEEMPISYYDSQNKKIWNADKNIYYKHRITGIGRDDRSGLYLNTSTNVSAENMPRIECASADSIADGHFLIWGDNGGDLSVHKRNGFAKLLKREWLLEKNGDFSGKKLNVEMDVLYFEDTPEEDESYWLIIDKSGLGTYPVGKTDYHKQSAREKQSIFFNSLQWDDSFSANPLFSLIQAPDFFFHKQVFDPLCSKQDDGKIEFVMVGGKAPYRVELRKNADLLAQFSTVDSIAEITALEAGSYTLQVKESSGKSYEEQFYISHKDVAPIILEDKYILKDEEPLLIDASANHSGEGYLFTWRQADIPISNSPILAVSKAGKYEVELCDQRGCRQTTSIEVGEAPKNNFKEVALFPNPTPDGNFCIRMNLYEASEVQLFIHGIRGDLLYQTTHGPAANFHAYKGLLRDTGVFMITLKSGESTETLKLVRVNK